MKKPILLAVMLRHELRMQWRTHRFRLGLLFYLALAIAPPAVLAMRTDQQLATLRTVSYLTEAFQLLPFGTVLLSLIVVGNTAHQRGQSQLLVSAPVSNAGFILRKWLVQTALVLTISLSAVAAALALSVIAEPSRIPLQQALGKWLVLLVPRAVICCAGWLGAVLLLRSEVAALIATSLLPRILTSVLNQVTYQRGVVLDEFSWLEFRTFVGWAQGLFYSLSADGDWYVLTPASDADFPVATAFSHLSTRLILPACTALVFLAVGIAHLDRCRADVRPSPLGKEHPLRNLAKHLQSFRERMRSDAALTFTDRLWRWVLVVSALGFLVWGGWRALYWNSVAVEQYQAEISDDLHTTSRDIVPGVHRITGWVAANGRVQFESEIELSNQGPEPVDLLAFELAPELELTRFDVVNVSAALRGEPVVDHKPELARRWDRLQVILDPPIEPHGQVTLRVRTSGRPIDRDLRLLEMSNESFATAFDRHRDPQFPRDVSPLLHSRTTPRVSGRGTLLRTRDILPQLRFDSWQLTPEASALVGNGREVPVESHHPTVSFAIEATLPEGWILVDSCGESSSGKRSLVSSCNLTLEAFALAGGERQMVGNDDGSLTVATISGHQALGREVFEALDRVARHAAELLDSSPTDPAAKPDDFKITALEMPDSSDLLDQRSWRFGENRVEASTLGRLILLPERRLLRPEPLAAEQLVSSVLLHDLSPRYPMPPDDQRAFLALHRALLLSRSGVSTSSAVIVLPAWARYRIYRSLLHSNATDSAVWQVKVPAILRDLEHKVGRALLFDIFSSFVTSSRELPSEPGAGKANDQPSVVTLADIFATVGARSNLDLTDYYKQYIAGSALPALRLSDTETRRERSGYRVIGTLTNSATGDATCEISVKTARGEVSQIVSVAPRSATPFEIVTDQRPFTVTLDPHATCFRLRTNFVPDSVALVST